MKRGPTYPTADGSSERPRGTLFYQHTEVMAMTLTESDSLFFLGEKHMIPMILYIRDHPGCRRIEIYNLIGRNPRSNAKLRMLVTNDIVSIIDYTNSSSITLTERGVKLAQKLTEMMEIMRG